MRFSRDAVCWVCAAAIGLMTAFGLTAGAAWAQDAQSGQALAQQWCTACHAIEPDVPAKTDAAPSFPNIVNAKGRSDEWISTWLVASHDVMPDFSLTRMEIADLVAYFGTLRD